MVQTKDFNIFDFDYNLYDPNHKEEFEKKFIDYFFYREIGFETIGRFKKALQNMLNYRYDYWCLYYETILKTKDVDFMSNKFYTETYERNVNDNSSTSDKFENNSNTSSSSLSQNKNTHKESDTPQSSIDNVERYMSNASITDNSNNDNSNSKVDNNGNSSSNTTRQNSENYTLNGKGSIGVVTNSDFLKGWRSILVDMDLLIFEELDCLFMQIF